MEQGGEAANHAKLKQSISSERLECNCCGFRLRSQKIFSTRVYMRNFPTKRLIHVWAVCLEIRNKDNSCLLNKVPFDSHVNSCKRSTVCFFDDQRLIYQYIPSKQHIQISCLCSEIRLWCIIPRYVMNSLQNKFCFCYIC